MASVFAIARISLLRMLRERSNLFFVFVFPMMLVLLIGLSFGSQGGARIVVVGGGDDPGVAALVATIDAADGVSALRMDSRDLALDALSRGRVDGLVVPPDDFWQALEQRRSQQVEVAVRQQAGAVRVTVDAAIAALVAPHRAAALAEQLGASADSVRDLAAEERVPAAVTVATTQVGDGVAAEFASLGQFELGAATQLVLFVFITGLGGAQRIVESRELGTTRRMLASPTTPSQVVLGEGLGRFAVALFQAVWIVLGSMVLFGVDWGAPLPALLVISALALAASSSALLLGAVATNVNQAGGLGTLLGLTLAALGGCMAPLDIFSDGLRRLAHVTPHAWANDAFAELTRRDGGLLDVLPEVGVLLAFAAVLGLVAARRLRQVITEA